MSLEEALNRNTDMLERLCSIMGAVPFRAPDPEVVKEPKAVSVKIESKKSLDSAPIATAEVVEVPNEKSQTTTDTSPSSEPESAPVTYDDVKKATNALSAAKGRDVTIDTLSRFGVKRATELDASQWADYIAYTEKVTSGEEA